MNIEDKEKLVSEIDKIINGVLKEKNLAFMKDELYDMCMVAFVRGLNAYDKSKGAKPKTYIVNCIKTEIAKYFYIQNMKKRLGEVLSYNVIVDENGTEMIDLIADDYNLEGSILLKENNAHLYMAIQTLPKRNREILCSFYGVFGCNKKNIKELAKEYNVSVSRIMYINRDNKRILKMILKDEIFSKYIKSNYDRFLNSKDFESTKREIIVEKKLNFRQKEYLLKSLKRNWKEEN